MMCQNDSIKYATLASAYWNARAIAILVDASVQSRYAEASFLNRLILNPHSFQGNQHMPGSHSRRQGIGSIALG